MGGIVGSAGWKASGERVGSVRKVDLDVDVAVVTRVAARSCAALLVAVVRDARFEAVLRVTTVKAILVVVVGVAVVAVAVVGVEGAVAVAA